MKLNFKSTLTLTVATLLLVLGCAENSFISRALTRTNVNPPEEVVVTPTIGEDPTKDYFEIVNTWTQPTSTGQLANLEAVFVVDTSGSMSNEVAAIKNSIIGWVDQLESLNVVNICLGVMRGHVNATTTGRLVAASGNDECSCTFGENQKTRSAAINEFRENLDQALGSSGGGAVEAGIYSMTQALNNPAKLAANQIDGCFREDASLATILLSDENDTGYTSNSATLIFDNSNLEFPEAFTGFVTSPSSAPYYNAGESDERTLRRQYYTSGVAQGDGTYINTITATTLAADLQAYNGSLPTFGTAIGYFPGGGTGGQPYWGGMQFADLYGFPMTNLQTSVAGNEAAFQQSMNEMADQLATTLSYYAIFDLTDAICIDSVVEDEDNDVTIADYVESVSVNGTVLDPSEYTVNATSISINPGFNFTPGSAVKVTFIACQDIVE